MGPLRSMWTDALSVHTTRVAKSSPLTYFIVSYQFERTYFQKSLECCNFIRVDVSISNECVTHWRPEGRSCWVHPENRWKWKLQYNSTELRMGKKVKRMKPALWAGRSVRKRSYIPILKTGVQNMTLSFCIYCVCLPEVRLTEACSHFIAKLLNKFSISLHRSRLYWRPRFGTRLLSILLIRLNRKFSPLFKVNMTKKNRSFFAFFWAKKFVPSFNCFLRVSLILLISNRPHIISNERATFYQIFSPPPSNYIGYWDLKAVCVCVTAQFAV
jgi:hypothetical protein